MMIVNFVTYEMRVKLRTLITQFSSITFKVTFFHEMNRNPEAENLFKKLDTELLENIDAQYFLETRDFR